MESSKIIDPFRNLMPSKVLAIVGRVGSERENEYVFERKYDNETWRNFRSEIISQSHGEATKPDEKSFKISSNSSIFLTNKDSFKNLCGILAVKIFIRAGLFYRLILDHFVNSCVQLWKCDLNVSLLCFIAAFI